MLKTLAPLQTVILGDAMLVSNFDVQLRQKVIFTGSEVSSDLLVGKSYAVKRTKRNAATCDRGISYSPARGLAFMPEKLGCFLQKSHPESCVWWYKGEAFFLLQLYHNYKVISTIKSYPHLRT